VITVLFGVVVELVGGPQPAVLGAIPLMLRIWNVDGDPGALVGGDIAHGDVAGIGKRFQRGWGAELCGR
jgi:hypothetical protein